MGRFGEFVMKTIVVDAALRDRMLVVGKKAVIQDTTGKVIGRFLASPNGDESADDQFPSDEELDRRTRESPRYTAEQVMERLRSLRRSE
jgi:hypothetical protein